MSAAISSIEENRLLGSTKNILLGVTGSVAAVKVPELISRLLDRFGPNISIKVVLTQGGRNFWEKASTYDPAHWKRIQHLLELESAPGQQYEAMTNAKIQLYCKCSKFTRTRKRLRRSAQSSMA